MPGKILPFPSGRLVDGGKKRIRRDYAFGECAQARHVARPRSTTAGLPVIPDLPYRPDAGRSRVQGKILSLSPRAERVLGSNTGHIKACKLIAYRLTRDCKLFSGSIVSADILQFRAMTAPNRIRELRSSHGLSQQALGDLAGCSKMTISDLERGNMELTLDYMRRLAAPLGVKPADLLLDTDNPDRLTAEERELIRDYRAAEDGQKRMIMRIAEPVDQPEDGRRVA